MNGHNTITTFEFTVFTEKGLNKLKKSVKLLLFV